MEIIKKGWWFLLNAYLLSPFVLFNLITEHKEGFTDIANIWGLLVSILVLAAVQISIRRQLYAHVLLLPVYIFVLVDLFIIYIYGSRLSAGHIWLMIANVGDWLGYLETYMFEALLSVFALITFYFLALWQIRDFRHSANAIIGSACFVCVLGLYFAPVAKGIVIDKHRFSAEFMNILEHDFSTPFGTLSQSLVVYTVNMRWEKEVLKRDTFSFQAGKVKNTEEREIYVLIIGESARRQNWSLYGYSRETTPSIEKIENRIVFEDVITEIPSTQKAVLIMLTRGTIVNFTRSLNEKSLLAAFKESGFHTSWITNQPFDQFAGLIHKLAQDADDVRYFTRSYDKVLLNPLSKAIQGREDVFIVLHTKGSHTDYAKRYPFEFNKFRTPGGSPKDNLVNAYDNSILYTDSFISDVIEIIENQKAVSALLYVSDHGENLMDTERNLKGHGFSNQYELQIPTFVWFSEKYRELYPEKIIAARGNIDKKISISNIFYSILDIADIRFDGFDSSMSFFNIDLVEKPRLVYELKGNSIFDYDLKFFDAEKSEIRR